jgi:hypothetical protein
MDYVPMITPEKVQFIFETIEAAQVSITDFSHLVSTSRNSLHRWRNAGKVSDRLRFNLAYQTALRMSYAVDAKQLPLPDKVSKTQRLSTLRRIIKDASHHISQ